MKTLIIFLFWISWQNFSYSQLAIEFLVNPKFNNYGHNIGTMIPDYFGFKKVALSHEFGISFLVISKRNSKFLLGFNYSTNIYKQLIYKDNNFKKENIIFRSSNQISKFYLHFTYRFEKLIGKQKYYLASELGVNMQKTGGFQINSKIYTETNNSVIDTITIYRIPQNLNYFPILAKLEFGTSYSFGNHSKILTGIFIQFGEPSSTVNWIINKNNIQEGNFFHYRSNISYGLSIKYQYKFKKTKQE